MERLQSVTVTIKVDTNKQSHTETLQLGDAEARDEFALRVAQAARESLGDDHAGADQEYASPSTCPCRLCPALAVRDGYCRGHQ